MRNLVLAASLLALLEPTVFSDQSLFAPAATMQTRVAAPGEVGVPRFELDPAWPKIPEGWKLGPVSNAAADADDNIWIIHRPNYLPESDRANAAPSVLQFDNAGNFIQGWGGKDGPGYEWTAAEHGVHIDYKGYVWVVGLDHVLLKFTKAGKFVLQIGRRGQPGDNDSIGNFARPAAVWVHPDTNELFVADGYDNQRVIVFDADTGQYKRHWGAYGKKPAKRLTPPSAPQDPAEARPWRHTFAASLQGFSEVHDVAVSRDGLVYAADRGNNRIQVFTIDGRYVAQQFVGLDVVAPQESQLQSRGVAFSADPAQTFLYVAGNPEISILNRRTLQILGSFVTGNPEDEHPYNHHIATDRKGNIYTASTNRGPDWANAVLIRKWVFKGP